MPYKYSQQTVNLNDAGHVCYHDYTEKEIIAYRWVFPANSNKDSFLPLALDPDNSSSRKRCSGWALSFHETVTASENQWDDLMEGKPNKFKKIGTHIAVGSIIKTDGKCGESNKSLHFNFIEYKNIDLSQKFTIVKQLATDEMIAEL